MNSRFAVSVMGMMALLAACASAPQPVASAEPEVSVSPVDLASQRMREAGLHPSFIEFARHTFIEEERNRIVELNVLGFLGKADYSGHYSKKAILACRKFIRKNKKALSVVEKKYGVSSRVIAALLWVETKHGKQLGKHLVSNVYFSLLQADHPEVVRSTLKALPNRVPAQESVTSEIVDKAKMRSQLKAQWALRELTSLEKIYTHNQRTVRSLKGSYAGAFGIPQFIPSSYLQWGSSNLFTERDAIVSVANYLKSNGWDESSADKQREALFHYNRAKGYVDVIQQLASAL